VKSEWAKNPDRSLPLPYYGFDHVRLCIGHGDQVEGHYSAWLRDKLDGAADPRGPANAIKAKGDNLAQIWKTSVPEELYPTSYIKQEAIEFLDQHAESEAPLLLVVSFPDPHHPFTPPGKYSEMYDPKDIPLPKTFDHSIDQRNDVPEGIRQSYEKGAENPNAYWPFHPDAEHLKQMIALNYGSITMIDDAIGKILDHYARLRPEQENVVCFMSDHGDYMGDHGAILKQGLHYNGITQVPFIWMDSEADKPDVSPLQASAIDFAPTLLQRAGLRIPIGMQGDDLFAQNAENKPILIEDPGIGVSFHGDARTAVLSLIHEGWRISIFERSDLGELYNRIEDPDELNNLWASMEPAILQKKTEMLFHLSQRQLELRDLSLTASNQA
jgi:arylsulfatase A-like enzyme